MGYLGHGEEPNTGSLEDLMRLEEAKGIHRVLSFPNCPADRLNMDSKGGGPGSCTDFV